MKKNLFLKSNNKILIVISTVILLFFLHFIGLLQPFENFLIKIVSPLGFRLYAFSQNISTGLRNISSVKSLALENEDLKKKFLEKTVNEAKLEELTAENETLKKLLNFVQEKKLNVISGNVIGKGNSNEFNSIIINIGSKQGIKEGQAVISEEGVMVGKIFEVHRDYSSVLPVTDDHSKTAVSILNKDKTIGLLEGKYGLSSVINLIPQNEEIKENDIIITSGLEQNIPQGIVIGQVDKVTNELNNLFKSSTIRLFVDLNKIKIISVVI